MKKTLLSFPGEISKGEPFEVVLPDKVEHDLTFKFYLREDTSRPESYTGFHVVTPVEAEISIFNAPEKMQTSVTDDINVGTYMKKYILYLNYVLQLDTAERGKITVKFLTEEK